MKQLFILLIFPILVSAQGDINVNSTEWLTNYEKAIKKAEKKNTNVLVFFTGSDWCAPCKMLKKDLFETTEFISLAKNYTLLYIDIPMNRDILTEKQYKHNKVISSKLNEEGAVPLLKIIDSSGNELDKISGYSMNGEIQYHLDLLKRYK